MYMRLRRQDEADLPPPLTLSYYVLILLSHPLSSLLSLFYLLSPISLSSLSIFSLHSPLLSPSLPTPLSHLSLCSPLLSPVSALPPLSPLLCQAVLTAQTLAHVRRRLWLSRHLSRGCSPTRAHTASRTSALTFRSSSLLQHIHHHHHTTQRANTSTIIITPHTGQTHPPSSSHSTQTVSFVCRWQGEEFGIQRVYIELATRPYRIRKPLPSMRPTDREEKTYR
jgi:hypothetical protein